jgi:ribosomal protein S18 acetylase RimI-like enzyme
MLTIRPAQWPRDIAALSALDTEMVTETIYRPVHEELAFRLIAEHVDPPLRKRYPFQPADPAERKDWDFTAVAEEEGVLAGFAAAQYVEWNRRVVLWHLYVVPAFRRQGVGARLLTAVDAFALSVEARCVWLETQNVNAPAIRFYRHSGFQFCGFDTTLYDSAHTPETEIALFFARPIVALPQNLPDTL